MANGKSYSVLLGYATLLRSPCVALQPAERWQVAVHVEKRAATCANAEH